MLAAARDDTPRAKRVSGLLDAEGFEKGASGTRYQSPISNLQGSLRPAPTAGA